MTIQALFVDRDGTINVDKGYVHLKEDFEYIPGSLAALRMATENGIKVFVVTNQAGIAKGLYHEQDFHDLTAHMLSEMRACRIEIAEVLYCPHHPEGTVRAYTRQCDCRKPGIALLQRVMEREHYEPQQLALIGDKNSDVEAGLKLGITTYLVETGYGSMEKKNTRAENIVQDLQAAIYDVLRKNASREESNAR